MTAEFNRNMLRVLNHELGADFDPARLRASRVLRAGGAPDRDASGLDARRSRSRFRASEPVRFAAGESIRTEISCKYDRSSVAELFAAAGLRIEAWRTDPESRSRWWWERRA